MKNKLYIHRQWQGSVIELGDQSVATPADVLVAGKIPAWTV